MTYTIYEVILSIVYYLIYYMRGSYDYMYYIYMILCHPPPMLKPWVCVSKHNKKEYIVVYCLSLNLKNEYIVITTQPYRIKYWRQSFHYNHINIK